MIWRDLVFALAGNTFPFTDHVCGIRLIDRLKKFNVIKIELWIDAGTGKFKKGDP